MVTFFLHDTKKMCTQSSHFTCSTHFPDITQNSEKLLSFTVRPYHADYFKPILTCVLILFGGLVVLIIVGPLMRLVFVTSGLEKSCWVEERQPLILTINDDEYNHNKINCQSCKYEQLANEPLNESQETTEPEFLCGLFRKTEEPAETGEGSSLFAYVVYSIQICWTIFVSLQTLRTSKNLDVCLHNFRCLRPLWGLQSFNHVLAVTSFPVCGIVVFLVAFVKVSGRKFNNYMALGVSLFVYGISFMAYKACPTYESYQFSKFSLDDSPFSLLFYLYDD